jgi:hypothetical protein
MVNGECGNVNRELELVNGDIQAGRIVSFISSVLSVPLW